jgi:hypothetical protein
MPITITLDEAFTDLLRNNLAERYMRRKRPDDQVIHVSDILPSTCLRRRYCCRKFPKIDSFTNESVYYFIRGESSELIISRLSNIGACQAPVNNSDMGIQEHPIIFITSHDNNNSNNHTGEHHSKNQISKQGENKS